jgi:hypothetical protein
VHASTCIGRGTDFHSSHIRKIRNNKNRHSTAMPPLFLHFWRRLIDPSQVVPARGFTAAAKRTAVIRRSHLRIILCKQLYSSAGFEYNRRSKIDNRDRDCATRSNYSHLCHPSLNPRVDFYPQPQRLATFLGISSIILSKTPIHAPPTGPPNR